MPTAARTNARIDPGLTVGVAGGGQHVSEGKNEATDPARSTIGLIPGESVVGVHVEVGLEYGWEREPGDAVAVQLKVPISGFFATLDGYYQLPVGSDHFFAGFGVELSLAPGIYAIMTEYLSKNLYITLTQRMLIFGVNPQIAVGLDGDLDVSIFASYLRFFGDGIDVDQGNPDRMFDSTDRRASVGLIGAQARF